MPGRQTAPILSDARADAARNCNSLEQSLATAVLDQWLERSPETLPDRLLSVAQTAQMLALSPGYVRQMGLPCVRIGKAIRYRYRDVLAEIRRRTD